MLLTFRFKTWKLYVLYHLQFSALKEQAPTKKAR